MTDWNGALEPCAQCGGRAKIVAEVQGADGLMYSVVCEHGCKSLMRDPWDWGAHDAATAWNIVQRKYQANKETGND